MSVSGQVIQNSADSDERRCCCVHEPGKRLHPSTTPLPCATASHARDPASPPAGPCRGVSNGTEHELLQPGGEHCYSGAIIERINSRNFSKSQPHARAATPRGCSCRRSHVERSMAAGL